MGCGGSSAKKKEKEPEQAPLVTRNEPSPPPDESEQQGAAAQSKSRGSRDSGNVPADDAAEKEKAEKQIEASDAAEREEKQRELERIDKEKQQKQLEQQQQQQQQQQQDKTPTQELSTPADTQALISPVVSTRQHQDESESDSMAFSNRAVPDASRKHSHSVLGNTMGPQADSSVGIESPGRPQISGITAVDSSPKVSPNRHLSGFAQTPTYTSRQESFATTDTDLNVVSGLSQSEISKFCRWVDDVVAARPFLLPLPDAWGEINEEAVQVLEKVERERRQRVQQRETERKAREQQQREANSTQGTEESSSQVDASPSVSRAGSRQEGLASVSIVRASTQEAAPAPTGGGEEGGATT